MALLSVLVILITSMSGVYVDNFNINLLSLLLALVVDLLGIPMVAVASNSLYSKITRKETQGRYTVRYFALLSIV